MDIMKKINLVQLLVMSSSSIGAFASGQIDYNLLKNYKDIIDHKYYITSSFHKKSYRSSKNILKELEVIQKNSHLSSNLEKLSAFTRFEQKEVCNRWSKVKKEVKYNNKKSYSEKDINFNARLSTSAAASGFTAIAGVAGGAINLLSLAGGAFGGLAGAVGSAGAFNFNSGLNYSNQSSKYNHEVNYYLIDENYECSRYKTYVRGVVEITPDLLKLDNQLTTEIFHESIKNKLSSIEFQLETSSKVLDKIRKLLHFESDDDFNVMINDDLRELFSGQPEMLYLENKQYIAREKLNKILIDMGRNIGDFLFSLKKDISRIKNDENLSHIYSIEIDFISDMLSYVVSSALSFTDGNIVILVDRSPIDINNSKMKIALNSLKEYNVYEIGEANLLKKTKEVLDSTPVKIRKPSNSHFLRDSAKLAAIFSSQFSYRWNTGVDLQRNNSETKKLINWANENGRVRTVSECSSPSKGYDNATYETTWNVSRLDVVRNAKKLILKQDFRKMVPLSVSISLDSNRNCYRIDMNVVDLD